MNEQQADAVPALETSVEHPADVATDDNTVTLKYPVTVQGTAYTGITLKRRLKVKDLLQADKQGKSVGEQEVIQIALMAGIAPDVIKELDASDYGALQGKVKDFLS